LPASIDFSIGIYSQQTWWYARWC